LIAFWPWELFAVWKRFFALIFCYVRIGEGAGVLPLGWDNQNARIEAITLAFLKHQDKDTALWGFVRYGKYTKLAVSFGDFNGQLGISNKAHTARLPSTEPQAFLTSRPVSADAV
jgi:hypothetical protein